MSQKRPLIRSTLVLAFERGKEEEEECKAKESKKKINALRLSSIIFVVALVYVVVYVVVVNSLIEDIIEKNFAYSFSCLTSLSKKKERQPFCAREKKGKTPTTFFWDSTTKKRIILHNTKAKKKTRKKENERRGSGNV